VEHPVTAFENLLNAPDPVLALAPMPDVTDLPFWGLMNRYGGARDLLRLAKAR
jgi:tRNA-dihydrouridine synthase B